MSYPPTAPIRRMPTTSQLRQAAPAAPPQGITPISGVAVAAFWFSLIGPATLGVGSALAIILAVVAGARTRSGERGGHFLTVTAMFFGVFGLLVWLAVVFYLRGGLQHVSVVLPAQ